MAPKSTATNDSPMTVRNDGSGTMEPSDTVLQFFHVFAQLSSNEIGLKAETRKMYQSSINGLTSMALDQGTKASLRKWGQLITVPGPFLKSREWRVQRSSCMCLTNL